MIGPFVSAVGANMMANGFFEAYKAPKTSPMPSATAPVKSSPLPPKKTPSWRGQTDLATLGGFQEPLKADNPSATFINVSFTKTMGSFASSNTLAPVGPDGSKTPLQPAKDEPCESCQGAAQQWSYGAKVAAVVVAALLLRRLAR